MISPSSKLLPLSVLTDRKEEDAHHQEMSDLSEEINKINEQLLNSTRKNQTAVVADPVEEERNTVERMEAAKANKIAHAEEEYAQQRKEKLQNYEDAFRQISAATGISDVNRLVKEFIKNEEHNFPLSMYSNEQQAAEIDWLQEDVEALPEEEMTYKEVLLFLSRNVLLPTCDYSNMYPNPTNFGSERILQKRNLLIIQKSS